MLVEESVLIENQVPLWQYAHFLWATKVLQVCAISAENKTQYNQTKDYPWMPFVHITDPV